MAKRKKRKIYKVLTTTWKKWHFHTFSVEIQNCTCNLVNNYSGQHEENVRSWNCCSVWNCNIDYIILCICQNPYILVCWGGGCGGLAAQGSKIPQAGWLKEENLCLTVLRLEVHDQGASIFVFFWDLFAFSCVFTWSFSCTHPWCLSLCPHFLFL